MRIWLMGAVLALGLASGAQAADQEVSIPAGKGELHGSLRMPASFTKGPAVLMIAGSGPTDRNGDSSLPSVKPGSFRLLADALEAAGIPTLRYDKRGSGKDFSALIGRDVPTNENVHAAELGLRFTDYANDAAAFGRLLAGQPGVRCVIVLGHSEGSLVGMLAAVKLPACGYISISGLGHSADQTLMMQMKAALPADQLGAVADTLAKLKAGQTVPNPPVPAMFRPSVQPYLISWLSLDPAVEVTKIKAPVLILQGDNDIQVGVPEAQALKAARPDATLVIVPGMNHVLKPAPIDRAGNVATYADPALPLAPQVPEAIIRFVKGVGARH